jgi:RTX calcium-binding nonapeptide repeat (4 copies)
VAADAATLSVADDRSESDGRVLTYTAGPNEQNRLAVTETDAAVTFHDSGATIQLEGIGCDLANPSTAVCDKAEVGTPLMLRVKLEDGNDLGRADMRQGGAFDPEAGYNTRVVMQGGTGADELVGSDFSRQIGSNDLLRGGSGADRLYGRDGVDSLDGGPGPDRLEGGPGFNFYMGRGHDSDPSDDADVFVGSTGTDQLDYTAQYFHESEPPDNYRPVTASVRISGEAGPNDGLAGEGDDIGPGIETVHLGRGDDHVETGGDLTSVHGGGGNDELRTRVASGQVHVQGGPGDDVLTGAAGVDALSGHEGNDRLVGGPGRDTVSGDEGDDWIDTRDPQPMAGNPNGPNEGHDWVQCGAGQDEIFLDESELRAMAPWDGCELVHAPDGASWPPPVAPPAAIAPSAAAGEERVLLKLRCGADAAACSGALVLKTSKSKRVVARGSVTGRRGKVRRVSVPLTSHGRRILRRSSRVETKATLKPKAKGAKAVTERVVVKRR